MAKEDKANWRFDRRINLSVLLQVTVLASLILGSWVNLQRQLDLLQHDVTMLLQSQKESQQKKMPCGNARRTGPRKTRRTTAGPSRCRYHGGLHFRYPSQATRPASNGRIQPGTSPGGDRK